MLRPGCDCLDNNCQNTVSTVGGQGLDFAGNDFKAGFLVLKYGSCGTGLLNRYPIDLLPSSTGIFRRRAGNLVE